MTADNEKTQSDWAKLLPGRTAFLIIHGVGQQNQFETLSRFAAGLKIGIEDKIPNRPAFVRRELTKLQGRNDTYLSLKVPARGSSDTATEIDIYEYYYQPALQRQVSVGDVIDWLLKAAKRIRMLYEEDTYLRGRLKRTQQGSAGSGDQLERGYLLAPAARVLPFVIAGVSWLITVLKGVSASKWPIGPFRFLADLVIKSAYRFIANRLETLITEFAGDVTAYTAVDPKLHLHGVRDDILSGCELRIRDLLSRTITNTNEVEVPYYDQVVIAGHSLGSVVAYDALSRISNDVVTKLYDFPYAGERRLIGLVTFGSPLDKIALFFWPLSKEQMQKQKQAPNRARDRSKPACKEDYTDKSANFQVGMLDYHHGMRGMRQSVADYPSEVEQPEDRPLHHVAWLNFFHPRDAIAGHLDAYAGVKNLRRFGESVDDPAFPEAHSYYWYDPGMYECLIRWFVSMDGIRREDDDDTILEKLAIVEAEYNQEAPADGTPASLPPRPGPPLNR